MTRATVGSAAVCGVLAIGAGGAHADDTFEATAAAAVRVRDVGDLVWPVTAACDRGDVVAQRQCRLLRDRKASTLVGATLLVDGDPEAFTVGRWNPQRRSVPITLDACIACKGVAIDGVTWHVMGSGAPPRFEGGTLRARMLEDTARMFSDETAATAWTKSLENLRVQYLVKVPERPRFRVDGKDGLALDIVGYRVYAPCDGGVVVASPPAKNLAPDKKACPAARPARAPR
jgi:hypothetical protein